MSTYLIGTHLLECIHILDGQVVSVHLGSETIQSVLEVDGRPLLHVFDATVGFGAIAGIGTGLVWGESVVEAVILYGDTLLVLTV